jgi:hypothetical protein
MQRLTHLLERVDGVLKIVLCEAGGDAVGPFDLTPRDAVQGRPSAGRKHRELRSLVGRIVGKRQQTVGFEQVGCPLHTLTRQPHLPRNIGDGSLGLIERSEYLPARAGLAEWTRERIASAQKTTVQAKHFENQLGEGLARRGPLH